MKKFLLKIYDNALIFKDKITAFIFMIFNSVVKLIYPMPKVMEIEETIDLVAEKKLSIARFGDGEIKSLIGKKISFQQKDPKLSKKLKASLAEKSDGFLPCVPNFFDEENLKKLHINGDKHWKKHLNRYRYAWHKNMSDRVYGNSFISRFYTDLKDKSNSGALFEKCRKIWDGRDIIFIEGEQSRLGVGNDLFSNAASIRRILVPVTNAFDRYDEIFSAAKKFASSNVLFLLAAGPTATALALDIHKAGYQAVDIGHLDIQYELYLVGAEWMQPVKNKYVNEAGAGNDVGDIHDEKYESEIIAKII